MQIAEKECLSGQVDLRSDAQNYNVFGFSEMYAAHLEGPAGDPVFYGRLLIVIGFAISALGVGIKLFGPEVIYYDLFSGPTLIQYIQAYPVLVTVVGGSMMAWGGKQRNDGIIYQEEFLLSRYRFVTEEGRDVSDQVFVRHLGGITSVYLSICSRASKFELARCPIHYLFKSVSYLKGCPQYQPPKGV